MTELIHSLNSKNLASLMQGAGYRVEPITDSLSGVSFLRSATSGLSFDIRMGNRMPGEAEAYADAVLVAIFNIVGEMPLAPVNAWNSTRRFGRLQIDASLPNQNFLVLCMDLAVGGGVTAQYLRNQIGIWDGLVQQLVPWLRDALARINAANVVKVDAAVEPSAAEPAVMAAAGA